MNKKNLDSKITRYEFEFTRIKDREKINALLEKVMNLFKIGTYGGLNTDVLYEDLIKKGYNLKREEICPIDDEFIGLRMPNFWPINQGKNAMNIAMYYNWMQMKETMKKENLSEWNREARKTLGWLGMIEIQDTSKLIKRLNNEKWDFFSTPFTLTECARYLEGHDSKRLIFYKEFSENIRSWAKKQSFYDPGEWGLGKEKSKEIYKKFGRPSNVRFSVRKFWEIKLLNNLYNPEDRELNIISKEFSEARNPKAVLLGEDFLELEGMSARYDPRDHNLIRWFSKSESLWKDVPVKKNSSLEKQEKNAEILREKYPNSEIILLNFDQKIKRAFQLSKNDLKKEKTNLEGVLALMAYLDCIGANNYVEELEEKLE